MAVRALLLSSRRRHTRYWRDWSSDVCLPISEFPSVLRLHVPLEAREARLPLAAVAVEPGEIGRAPWRERVEISVVRASLKKNTRLAQLAVFDFLEPHPVLVDAGRLDYLGNRG